MPNGKIGDSPISDILLHGCRPFPDDIVEMVKRLYAANPEAIHGLGTEVFEWEKGQHLDNARRRLKALLLKHER